MNTSIFAAERAVTYSIESGSAIYRVSIGRTSMHLARSVGSGYLLVAAINVLGDQASCELDLRPWKPTDGARVISEVQSALSALRELNVTPAALALVTGLEDYLARFPVVSSD